MSIQTETCNPHRRIPASEVCQICGGISYMTLHRWSNSRDLDFPRPQYIGRRRYWREAEVVAWLDARESAAA
ncbi:helix-turn-helix transcriptional regulator [Ruegeria lacuscaerulensis]|uniref:helix-turn-helix transcriptional regulator n=1 Tax=Ruegeria lacuscaerulensis TaxID=55218 RepID=UPI001481983E|nr:helix-turn-helix domain-containing protein [Ruegeria lacuscaerulensis]